MNVQMLNAILASAVDQADEDGQGKHRVPYFREQNRLTSGSRVDAADVAELIL